MRSDLKKLDSFTLETSKNHLIRNFLQNERVRVDIGKQILNEKIRKIRDFNFVPSMSERVRGSWTDIQLEDGSRLPLESLILRKILKHEVTNFQC